MEETEFRTRERVAEMPGQAVHDRVAGFGEVAVHDGVAGREIVVRDGEVCPHCGAVLDKEYEWCPVCGGKLADHCTFCGAPMLPDDVDCPECGMPAEGVVCPDCGVRNFRSFCRQCGRPLSRAARRAVEKAKQDPKVLEAARLLEKISELEAELDGALPGSDADETPAKPTEGELWLKEMMAKAGITPAEKPRVTQRRMGRSREEVLAEYKKAVEEADRAMEEMLPPAGATPQEQRNYYTARKVAVMEVMEERWYGVAHEVPLGWICNRCQVLHNNPSECAVREFGGRWVTTTKYKVVDAGTEGAQCFVDRVEKKVYKRQ